MKPDTTHYEEVRDAPDFLERGANGTTISDKEIQAVGEVLLDACSNSKRYLRPWKPFDISLVARRCIEAYEGAKNV